MNNERRALYYRLSALTPFPFQNKMHGNKFDESDLRGSCLLKASFYSERQSYVIGKYFQADRCL